MITITDLERHGIKYSNIEPFVFHLQLRNELPEQQIGCSHLDRYPLIINSDTHIIVALPSSLTVAIRSYVIENIVNGGLVEVFNNKLARSYAELFSDTPLLGGPIGAPVNWKVLGEHRWSNFHFKVDEGYYISYHLFLTSVRTHDAGGFVSIYQVEDQLNNALQESINESLAHFAGKSDFKKGLVVLVGCGWGKGYATQSIELNNPDWRFQDMSAADLVRLSWLNDMNPSYFWRIQDGLEAVTKAGVQIINPNGIMNLIGWVRNNHGQFVPHDQLPKKAISTDDPMLLFPPLNLLREVRAAADQSYDRHSLIDNNGIQHIVQRVSPDPFFCSESSLCIYGSMGDVNNGTWTSVYEGVHHLWVTFVTPNITKVDIQYRLWETTNEWLHRIGNILDAREEAVTEKRTLKVYIEFRDADPHEEIKEKPIIEDLIPLCVIEAYNEPTACKAVFQEGFLSGFCIAENVAERLIVRNLARAFLHLKNVVNCDDEIKEIEARVIQNKEARNFHLIHTQQFMDYVRDSLPNNLVAIDTVDDATARIVLGWRANGGNQSNKIEGREECNSFLANIVDVLVDEIIDLLATFDRISTLKRLVGNCEKASQEKDHWQRTSAALLGLHGHDQQVVDIIVEQMSKFAGACIASRILIEIALCACPSESSAQLSNIEMSKLIARASLISQIGGLSDAIYYNEIPPKITISALGDILFRNEIGQLVVNPMLSQIIGDQFIENAPLQKKNYEKLEIITDIKEKVGSEFWDIWKNEMGFDPNEAHSIIDALENQGIKNHTAIYEITQNEYFSLVCSHSSVPKESASRFLNQFSLTTRPQWEKAP